MKLICNKINIESHPVIAHFFAGVGPWHAWATRKELPGLVSTRVDKRKSKLYYTCIPCSVSLRNILYIVIINVLLIINLIVAKFIYIRLKKSLVDGTLGSPCLMWAFNQLTCVTINSRIIWQLLMTGIPYGALIHFKSSSNIADND
jgi:hypothetical protein